jgi:hypothetical protein
MSAKPDNSLLFEWLVQSQLRFPEVDDITLRLIRRLENRRRLKIS